MKFSLWDCTPQMHLDPILSSGFAAYKAHFNVLMTAFGSKRLIWGSNWPVIGLPGTL